MSDKTPVYNSAKKGEKVAEKRRLTPGKVIRRVALCVGTALLALLLTVYSALFVLTHGPGDSLRDALVLSATQASATKWLPRLFLKQSTIDGILRRSEQDSAGSIDAGVFAGREPGEWDDAVDGMKLEFLSYPKFKAYLLTVRDPARLYVGVSSGDFASAKAGVGLFDFAEKSGAAAAINGGEFEDPGGVGTGARPMGLTYSGGKMVWSDGLKRTFIGFDKDNRLHCLESPSEEEARRLGIRDGVSFQSGNVLIDRDGERLNLRYRPGNTSTSQRTAIAQRADGAVLLLVTDGRSTESVGATRDEVIDILAGAGAVTAGMLDGGTSSMLYCRDYAEKYGVDPATLDDYQKKGLVNRYRAFIPPRRLPTYFAVKPSDGGR